MYVPANICLPITLRQNHMNILVTGGTGFIGTFLTKALISNGHQLTIITRDPQKHRPSPATSYISWNADLSEAAGQADAVVNMAGFNLSAQRWTTSVKKEILDSRLRATNAMTLAILKTPTPPKVFVSFSAVGYYGSRGDQKLPETAGPGDDFLAEVCRKWEEAATPVKDTATRLVVPRVGVVKHPSDGALAKMLLPFKMGVGGPLGSGNQFYPWIHMDDTTGLILHALDNEKVQGPMNVVAPGVCTMKAFASALGRVLGRPSLLSVPEFALRLALGEMASAVTASNRVIPEVALATGYQFRYPEAEQALRHLLQRD
jgi:uncharacterized protein